MARENNVGKLNEYAHQLGISFHFEDLGSQGRDHNKTFNHRISLKDKVLSIGVGKTKKEAKQDAAEKAWKFLENRDNQDSVNSNQDATGASAPVPSAPVASAPEVSAPEASAPDHQESLNYICWLNQYGQRNSVTPDYRKETRPQGDGTIACCWVVLGGVEYPVAFGKTPRQAKEAAAKLVYDRLNDYTSTQTTEGTDVSGQCNAECQDNVSDVCNSTQRLSLNSTSSKVNYIGLVNDYCQKTGRTRSYILISKTGPAHNPRHVYKLQIDNKEYDEAEGRTVKEAQHKAAALAWSALQQQSDWDSKVSLGAVPSGDDEQSEPSGPSTTMDSSEPSSHMSNDTSGGIVFADPSSVQGAGHVASPVASGLASQPSSEPLSESSPDDEGALTDTSLTPDASNASFGPRFFFDFDDIVPRGEGGFGKVYKARQKLTGRCYAVKIVHASEKALREVRALSRLNHKNIVLYNDCWIEDSRCNKESGASSSNDPPSKSLYIKMELCDSKTLSNWINSVNEKTLTPNERREESLPLTLQIFCGVEYIHSEKLIHRDLKPTNIMFGQGGEVKIGDFGLVTAEADDGDQDMIKRTQTGTKSYMAPEQISNPTYDQKVDMYALGLIFFELLWKLSTTFEKALIWKDVREQKFPEKFSEGFKTESSMIYLLLSKRPEDRPKASDLVAWLKEWKELFSKHRNEHLDSVTV